MYVVGTFAITLYMDRKGKKRIPLTLLLFLLSVALAYVSFTPAQLGDSFAYLLYNTMSLLSISLLAHFLVDYFALLGISWSYIRSLQFFYSFPVLAFLCSLGAFLFPVVTSIVDWITILLFTNGLLNILVILFIGYKRSKAVQLKWLTCICIAPFLPFVLGYIVPKLLQIQPIIAAEVAAFFFILTPLSFIVFQLTERLFGLPQYVSRIRYFSLITFVTSLLLTLIFYIFTPKLSTALLFFSCCGCILFVLLFVKEHLDFKHRKQQQTIRTIDAQMIFHSLQKAYSKQQLFKQLKLLLKNFLQLEQIHISTHSSPAYELRYVNGVYEIGIQENVTLQIGQPGHMLQLLEEEVQLLEIVAPYVDVLLQHFNNLEEIAVSQPITPSTEKLAWQIVEREKRQLAQELHDTILQEQLQLARLLDMNASNTIIREQLLDINFELREFCETLHPPLLHAVGLEAALQKLVQSTKLRANFILAFHFQLTKVEDDTLSLLLYRTIQELLSNAMKHANAEHVTISLTVFEQFYTLSYEDDGIGFTSVDHESFGLSGMQQRHEMFGGVMRKLNSTSTKFIFSNRKEHIDAYSRRG